MELYSVIKNDGPAGALFWKHEKEDFRTGSQLIVAENEEALFVRDGVVVETFSGGKYTLKTNNYPFIDRLRKMFSGGVNAFHCKVFFVNKADALDLKWGTDTPIQVRDPKWQIITHLQGRGAYTVRVSDAKKFVLKFVANNTQGVGDQALRTRFREAFLQHIKSCIAKGVKESGEEVMGIVSELGEFASRLQPMLAPVMDEYGLELVNFYVSALDIPEDDPSRQELERALGANAGIAALDANWSAVQTRDLLKEGIKNNSLGGGLAGAGMGLGMGVAMGGAMGGALAGAGFGLPGLSAQPAAPTGGGSKCSECGADLPAGAKFCFQCGKAVPSASFCIHCGQPLPSGAKFCPSCGKPQS